MASDLKSSWTFRGNKSGNLDVKTFTVMAGKLLG